MKKPHHNKGRAIGDSLHDVESLRLRSWIDPNDDGHGTKDGPCWHLRSATGRPLAPGARVWVHGTGSIPVPRAAWSLAHPKGNVGKGRVCYRKCASADCANPAHIGVAVRSVAAKAAHNRGAYDTELRRQMIKRLAARRRKVTPEIEAWIVQSTLSGPKAAAALGLSINTIYKVRRAAKARREHEQRVRALSSVFALGSADLPTA